MDAQVGQRVRATRIARGLSLKEVSAKSGLSIGLLSQVERGISSPSVRVLGALSGAMNVAISHFFPDPPESARDPDSPIIRQNQRPAVTFWRTGIAKSVLTPHGRGNMDLVLYTIIIEPNGTTGDEPFTHDGEEAGVVLEGTLDLHIGDQEYVLNEGDGFRFSSATPHRFFNSTKRPTKVMWVNCRESAV
ncbi:hypothetical protein AW878_07850 [Bordetella pseudohinzii]|nr:hypothetical protein BBN53_15820 [Bordetella pseudohinzii]KMM24893.1 hypothetical protein L540_03440 [Bordetella pseudohinzii]KXA75162.1 hypothetical protein AW877_20745 [Bordetella pseudohinzii]KXA80188.1 hypothetical protein AW878_07850 [Bordetella pseudohinzii]